MAAFCLMAVACGGDPRSPTDILSPPGNPTGSSQVSPVVGTWRTVIIISLETDIQRWETTWQFERDRTCNFTRVTESLLEGISRTVERACRFVDRGTFLEVTYDDTDATERLPYEFPGFDRDRLILEGIEYERIE